MVDYSNLRSKVLFLVLTCGKYRDRIDTFHNIIGSHVDCLFCSDHVDVSKNVLSFSDSTDYNSNEEKQINAANSLKTIVSEKTGKCLLDSYDWFFFCDCDTFVNLKKINSIIDDFDHNVVYGHLINIEKYPQNPIFVNPTIPIGFEYLSGGVGFISSRQVISKVEIFKNYQTNYADVSMGLNWHYNNIKVKNLGNDVIGCHLNGQTALMEIGCQTIFQAMTYLNELNNV